MLFLSSCTCFQPCMVLHKTTQHGSTCSFIHQFKNNVDILHIGGSARMNYSRALLCCDWNLNLPSIDSGAEESTIYFLLYNSKVKPCGRTTQFSAGLHCQARN
jgi:hypothetical protein